VSNEEFDFFLFQLLLKRGPIADVQKHPYVGVVAVKLLDHAGNDVVAKKRTQAKPDLAAGACTQSPDFVFEGVGLADDVSGQPDDLMPGMCNCDGRVGALEYLQPDVLFKVGHAATQRRLTEKHLFACATKVQRFGD